TIFLLFFSITAVAQPTGVLTGVVKDKKTQELLPGVTISLEGTSLGTASDPDGSFRLADIPAKTYNIKAQAVNYNPQILYNIVITTGNAQVLTIEMEENTVKLDEVVVNVNPFRKNAETPLSI